MARIAGVELPHHKRMEIALTYIYGIGRSAAQKILAEAKVDPARNSDDLGADEQVRIRNVIDEKFKVEGDLRREVQQSIKRLMDLAATAVSAIAADCRRAASVRIPTRARAKARAKSWRARNSRLPRVRAAGA